ncbi:putative permease C29B12.14c [Verticillium dahliae VDG1]|nr:putative permease C29B12.14c [Verticillium dahliae VDG1]
MRFHSLVLAASAAPVVLGCAIPITRTVVVEVQLYPVATQVPPGPDALYPAPPAETPSDPAPLVAVTGPNGDSITAMIVDQCPECDEGHLDLFQNAFEKIGTLSEGIISTSYEFVDCGISSPIVLKNKSGTSPFWFSMQVVNATERVAKLEVSTDGGSTWQSTQRKDYNFFEQPSGFGTPSVDVRVTSVSGKVVVVRNVPVASDEHATASSNF